MNKILISINNHIIYFSNYNKNSKNKDSINTQIMNNNELVFSEIFINDHIKDLQRYIKELSIQFKINDATILEMNVAPISIKLLNKTDNIKNITFKCDDALTYEACESIINNRNIKSVNCYSLQPFMIELLDKNNITCESRSEILYLSSFMEKNNLLRYSNIYYKTDIRITLPLSLEDKNDFISFLKINKYLKTIHINKLLSTELDNLIKILIKQNKKNIRIVIHENINNEKTVNKLKNINKKYKKKYKILLSLEYSKDYLEKNILSQTIASILKVSGLIISSLVILVITYIGISNYVALKKVTAIKEDLAKVIETVDVKPIIDNKNEENKKEITDSNPLIEEPLNHIKLVSNEKLAALLSVNDQVVGELKVNNTNIDYPVVQALDNDYYLKHNINKEDDINGWLFLDYRNNSMYLGKNNIIYGHNMYYSGVMFGTLYKTTYESWYTNPENQIITYNTLYDKMKFKIFSIYRVPKTSDYIKVYFDNDAEFLNFIDMVKERSYYNFNVDIKSSDKILTLSTCSNNGTRRLVIHAVLIDENETNE